MGFYDRVLGLDEGRFELCNPQLKFGDACLGARSFEPREHYHRYLSPV
jgi:hypothetical protein